MKKHWVVVAESSRARILIQEPNRGQLTEQQDLVHPDNNPHDHDRQTLEPVTMPKEVETDSFARQIAAMLEHARKQNEIGDIVLVAPPQFLGLLTEHLGAELQKLVGRRIHKNLVRHSLADIAAHLAVPV